MAFESANSKKRQFLINPGEFAATEAKAALASADGAGTANAKGKSAAAKEMAVPQEAFDKKIEELKSMLQTALELEHSTIPPYLCALYSIKPDTNLMPVQIIRSVVIEEMLHMIMVANLINAIGGEPKIGAKETDKEGLFIPQYPTQLPGDVDPTLIVGLECFSKESIRTFWKIEHPEGGYKLPANINPDTKSFGSIGEFYKALKENIIWLETIAFVQGKTIFTGKPERQVGAEHYYGAGGKLFTVSNLEQACHVIDEIVGQGEGALGSIFSGDYDPADTRFLIFGPDVEEYAHYFRFKEVYYERFYAATDSAHRDSPNKGLPTGEPFNVDWDAVCRMKPNPKQKDYEGNEVLSKMNNEFNILYSRLLDNINEACNGNPEVLKEGIILMYDLKYKAIQVMNIPYNGDYMGGPSFEYIDTKKK